MDNDDAGISYAEADQWERDVQKEHDRLMAVGAPKAVDVNAVLGIDRGAFQAIGAKGRRKVADANAVPVVDRKLFTWG